MKRTPLKKHSTTTISKLKSDLWQLCRTIIFARHGNNCYTCPATNLTGSNRQCGHFISSSISSGAMRYDLDNLRPQCAACNIWRSGNWLAFETHLKADGIDPENLKRRNQETKGKQYDRLWYERQIAHYQDIANTL